MRFIYENGELIQPRPEKKPMDAKKKAVLSAFIVLSTCAFYLFLDGGASFLAFKLFSILDSLGWGSYFQHPFQPFAPIAI
jgi:hypothetical protein